MVPQQVADGRPDRRLRRCGSRPFGIGGVGEEKLHAFRAELPEARQVGRAAVDRREIELEVARVQDGPNRCAVRDRERVRHGVRHGNELALDRADRTHLAVGDRDQLGAIDQPGFVDAASGKAQCERGPVQGRRHVAQQIRESADVVFVAVGEHDAVDPLRVVAQVREVGQDEVDAGHVGLGEHEAAVDDDDPALDLDAEAVAPDLAETAEEDDPSSRGHASEASAGIAVALTHPVRSARGHHVHAEAARSSGWSSCAP